MAQITYNDTKSPEEKFGVPVGSYLARFLRTEDRKPFDGPSKYGDRKPEARMGWLFTVVEPVPLAGKVFEQGTGTTPGGKAKFTFMLRGLLGRDPQKGEQIDTDHYQGHLYRVEVEVNPQSDVKNLHIAYLKPQQAGALPAAPPGPPTVGPRPASAWGAGTPPAAPRVPTPPPVARPTVAPPPLIAAEPEEPLYHCYDGKEQTILPGSKIREMIAEGVPPSSLQLCSATSPETGWHDPAFFGLDEIPF